MTVDPDAPWWINTVLIIVLAAIPIVKSLQTANRSTRAAESSVETAEHTQEQLRRVLHNVENSHNIGLRDDLDEKVSALTEQMQTVSAQVSVLHSDVGSVHEELRGTRNDVTGVHEALRGAREADLLTSQRLTALEAANMVRVVAAEIMPGPGLSAPAS